MQTAVFHFHPLSLISFNNFHIHFLVLFPKRKDSHLFAFVCLMIGEENVIAVTPLLSYLSCRREAGMDKGTPRCRRDRARSCVMGCSDFSTRSINSMLATLNTILKQIFICRSVPSKNNVYLLIWFDFVSWYNYWHIVSLVLKGLISHSYFRVYTIQANGKFNISYTPCGGQKCGNIQHNMSVVSN